MHRILSVFFAISLIAGTIVIPALGQTTQTDQQKKIEKIRTQVKKLGTGEKAKIKVNLNDATTYQGYVKESSQDDFIIVDKAGSSATVKYSDVKSIGGKNLSTGAKIAIAASAIGAVIFFAVFWAVVQNDE